jgi:hypothetical protein
MARTSLAAGFAIWIATFAGSGLAQAQAEKALREALSLCTAALLKTPLEFSKVWLEAGFTIGQAQAVSQNWSSTGYTRQDTAVTLTELKFTSQQSTTCQYTAPVSVSLEESKAFGQALAKDTTIGPMEFEVGSVPMGADQTMILASMHRTGNDPLINGSMNARENFLFLTFTRTTLKAK